MAEFDAKLKQLAMEPVDSATKVGRPDFSGVYKVLHGNNAFSRRQNQRLRAMRQAFRNAKRPRNLGLNPRSGGPLDNPNNNAMSNPNAINTSFTVNQDPVLAQDTVNLNGEVLTNVPPPPAASQSYGAIFSPQSVQSANQIYGSMFARQNAVGAPMMFKIKK